MLSVENHDRDVLGLRYVYPVVSRRAGGLSLGINLNSNNQCNWQCIYCQVPNLKRGVADVADLPLLKHELRRFLQDILHGDYMRKHVPESCRSLKDIAISGNGEPTTCPNFDAVVELVVALMRQHGLRIPLRLITNGSSVHKPHVQQGLKLMGKHQGEVWFKVDAVGERATQSINGVSVKPDWQMQQLKLVAAVCDVKLQTCVLSGQSQDKSYAANYLAWLEEALRQGIKLKGVLLYGLARASMQPGGDTLQSADPIWMQDFAEKIESLGLSVTVSA